MIKEAAMLKTHDAGEMVPGGFYFNARDWTMRVVPRAGEVLPGGEDARYYAFPAVMMLVAAPLLSFAFVIFLPFIGLALLGKAVIDRTVAAVREAKEVAPADIVPRVWK